MFAPCPSTILSATHAHTPSISWSDFVSVKTCFCHGLKLGAYALRPLVVCDRIPCWTSWLQHLAFLHPVWVRVVAAGGLVYILTLKRGSHLDIVSLNNSSSGQLTVMLKQTWTFLRYTKKCSETKGAHFQKSATKALKVLIWLFHFAGSYLVVGYFKLCVLNHNYHRVLTTSPLHCYKPCNLEVIFLRSSFRWTLGAAARKVIKWEAGELPCQPCYGNAAPFLRPVGKQERSYGRAVSGNRLRFQKPRRLQAVWLWRAATQMCPLSILWWADRNLWDWVPCTQEGATILSATHAHTPSISWSDFVSVKTCLCHGLKPGAYALRPLVVRDGIPCWAQNSYFVLSFCRGGPVQERSWSSGAHALPLRVRTQFIFGSWGQPRAYQSNV